MKHLCQEGPITDAFIDPPPVCLGQSMLTDLMALLGSALLAVIQIWLPLS